MTVGRGGASSVWLAPPRSLFFTLSAVETMKKKMYRNIDEDERLLIMARRYWDAEDQLTEEQLHWVFKMKDIQETRLTKRSVIIGIFIYVLTFSFIIGLHQLV